MSTTLQELRTSIVEAIFLALPSEPNVYLEDPRETAGFESKIGHASGVRTSFIDDFNPSAAAQVDSSDYTANARIVMLRSISGGTKRAMQDDGQLVIRRLRDIAFNRFAVVVGVDTVTVADRYACYQLTISAEFYALQTIA